MSTQMRVRGASRAAGMVQGDGDGMYICMACARSMWGGAAGRVCAAARLGAAGVERRRTRRLTWMKMVRSIRRRRLVVDGGEDV